MSVFLCISLCLQNIFWSRNKKHKEINILESKTRWRPWRRNQDVTSLIRGWHIIFSKWFRHKLDLHIWEMFLKYFGHKTWQKCYPHRTTTFEIQTTTAFAVFFSSSKACYFLKYFLSQINHKLKTFENMVLVLCIGKVP